MKPSPNATVIEYKLEARFLEACRRLTENNCPECLDRTLAHWALANDRGLPWALMGRKVKELVATPFGEIYATSGIGPKKVRTLLVLLDRAVRECLDTAEAARAAAGQPVVADESLETSAEPSDPLSISEATWDRWRHCVQQHGLEGDPLGRYAVTLKRLPRVVWETQLGAYTALSLADIRLLKTHGEKRVRAIIETVKDLCQAIGQASPGHLTLRPLASDLRRAEEWVHRTLAAEGPPTSDEIVESFIRPLLAQVRIDAGDPLADLAERRLGLRPGTTSVRQSARRLGLTRARVYQRLAEIQTIMGLRWPEGAFLIRQLRARFAGLATDDPAAELFLAGSELFFCRGRDAQAFEAARPEVKLHVESRRYAG